MFIVSYNYIIFIARLERINRKEPLHEEEVAPDPSNIPHRTSRGLQTARGGRKSSSPPSIELELCTLSGSVITFLLRSCCKMLLSST
jgi:hypothetical protein